MFRTAIRRFGLGVVATATAASGALLAPAAHAAGTYNLLILPDQGENAIYNFIDTATKTVDVTMYELRDTTVTTALVNKQKAGVQVRVILDGKQTTVNSAAYSALQAGGVSVIYSSSSFTYTHQKTITVDGATSWISTGNLDSKYYATSRDYSVFDTDQNDVAAVEQVFNADFTNTSITPSDGDDLVWSPTDSQTHLLALINGATKTLDVQEEEFGDPALVNAIVAAAQRGVTVRCVLENTNSKYNSQISQVEAAGVKVTQYSSSTGFYVHAKAIVADYGTTSAKVFQGSENFSDNSLNNNRELGLIISDSGVLTGIENTFTADFNQVPSNGGGSSGSGCTAAGQLLGDPGFEDGTNDTAWTASTSALLNNDTTSEPAHSGSWDAWLGNNVSTTDTLAQTVTIPSGCTNYDFSFWLHTDTAETSTTSAYDTLAVQVLDASGNVLGTLHTFSNLDAATGYAQQTYSLAQYAGQTVTLRFTGTNDSEYPTSWVVDDTALTVS